MPDADRKRGAPKKDPTDVKKIFTTRLHPKVTERIKEICFRRSVLEMKKVSEAVLVETMTEDAAMPEEPTKAQIAAYAKINPKHVAEWRKNKRR